MAAGVFMAVDLRNRKGLAPKLRDVLEGLRFDFREHAGIDPDIGDAYAAAMNPPRQQQMRRLAPEERDSFGGADCDAHHMPGGAVNAARQVNAENGRALGID